LKAMGKWTMAGWMGCLVCMVLVEVESITCRVEDAREMIRTYSVLNSGTGSPTLWANLPWSCVA
jgi:hypothetical protein